MNNSLPRKLGLKNSHILAKQAMLQHLNFMRFLVFFSLQEHCEESQFDTTKSLWVLRVFCRNLGADVEQLFYVRQN